jgi:hypothetical protein
MIEAKAKKGLWSSPKGVTPAVTILRAKKGRRGQPQNGRWLASHVRVPRMVVGQFYTRFIDVVWVRLGTRSQGLKGEKRRSVTK